MSSSFGSSASCVAVKGCCSTELLHGAGRIFVFTLSCSSGRCSRTSGIESSLDSSTVVVVLMTGVVVVVFVVVVACREGNRVAGSVMPAVAGTAKGKARFHLDEGARLRGAVVAIVALTAAAGGGGGAPGAVVTTAPIVFGAGPNSATDDVLAFVDVVDCVSRSHAVDNFDLCTNFLLAIGVVFVMTGAFAFGRETGVVRDG